MATRYCAVKMKIKVQTIQLTYLNLGSAPRLRISIPNLLGMGVVKSE